MLSPQTERVLNDLEAHSRSSHLPGHLGRSIECGQKANAEFSFGKDYRNLNHGSFGAYPTPIRSILRKYQSLFEQQPDAFVRYDYPKLLDVCRKAIAGYINAPVEGCVFVPNATTGINTVLRNLKYEPKDVIIYFATIYGACGRTVEYITETTPASSRVIQYTYPISDTELCSKFEQAIRTIKAEGDTPRIAIFDTIASLPGVRMPFERLTELCRIHDVLSCIDGAHGVGHIPLDLEKLDPDFFVSNCHKWLYVPRGCAVFYVAARNHDLMRSTLPTSHGFVPETRKVTESHGTPRVPGSKSDFVKNFEFVGTVDNSPVLCLPAALEWRKQLSWQGRQGEDAIYAYNEHLANEAGRSMAYVLGTEVMDNVEATLTKCFFNMVRLPLEFEVHAQNDVSKANWIADRLMKALVKEYDTFLPIIFYGNAWWVRLSAQVYLDKNDFLWGAEVLKEICRRGAGGDWTE
ncbi:PLP-dependent transferase [Hortaea werneckii]|nr:PLP-dependent transferase [Hortaea werneckii]